MCFLEMIGGFLKEWGVTGVLFGVVIKYFVDQNEKSTKYKSLLKQLFEEVRDSNVDKGEFDSNPKAVRHRDPINLYSLELLFKNYYSELRKSKKLLNAVWNMNVSLQRMNAFCLTYNEVIWRERENVELKRKMFENFENNYLVFVREDRGVLIGALQTDFKEIFK